MNRINCVSLVYKSKFLFVTEFFIFHVFYAPAIFSGEHVASPLSLCPVLYIRPALRLSLIHVLVLSRGISVTLLLLFFYFSLKKKIPFQLFCKKRSSGYVMDFPRPDLGPNNCPFPIQKCAKTSQNGIYHSQFLSFTFW